MRNVKTALAAALLCASLALSACGTTTATTTNSAGATTTTTTSALTPIATLTQNDLAAAISIAQNASPPDQEGIQCFTYLSAQLTTLQGQAARAVPPAGVISTLEAGNVAAGDVANVMSQAQKTALEMNCGPLGQHIVGGAAKLLATLGLAVPGVGAVSGLFQPLP